ncbi:MAG: methyltransferase domain-containing protein [Treponema sp.]|jgi:2-polyprenyl-3-methyl-5-hydroxy-6-metoxy-1,4-benzoquinol methylase|nr:methyltransferase domain-containing protein [Treponema sp.]
MNSILVLPACEQGRGGGHLFRSTALVKTLRGGGAEAWLYSEKVTPGGELWLHKDEILQKNWTLIVLDRFRTEPEELKQWMTLGPVLGIDEGLSRNDIDFLIDLLPGFHSGKNANICAPFWLPLPKKRRPAFLKETPGLSEQVFQTFRTPPLKILISFGAEDAAGLTVNTALTLQNCTSGDVSFTVVLGPLRKNNNTDRKTLEQAGIAAILGTHPACEDSSGSVFVLQEVLADYDLLITHFGITAFEALYARVPVLLVNPGTYHERLSHHAGLATLDFASRKEKKDNNVLLELLACCAEKSEEAARRWGLETTPEKTLAELLPEAKPVIHRNCPLCGIRTMRVVGRYPGRTYRLCSCGMINMSRLGLTPVEYNRNYFFEEYQKQYGKTYLEDFTHIQKAGEKRLRFINTLLDIKQNSPNVTKRLLDIGCAYGPFLVAAREQGFDVTGTDPAPDAVEYVKKTLKINAVQGIFPESQAELLTEQKQFDVITMWYVIEHFENSGNALEAVNGLLKMGGVFAFSTPSSAGISRRKNLYSFLEQSPADHWSIWDPRRTAAILRRHGFLLKKRVITGHHPERFPRILPGFGQLAAMRLFCLVISRIFGLGDTFEAYAVKMRDICTGEVNG